MVGLIMEVYLEEVVSESGFEGWEVLGRGWRWGWRVVGRILGRGFRE